MLLETHQQQMSIWLSMIDDTLRTIVLKQKHPGLAFSQLDARSHGKAFSVVVVVVVIYT